jgi:hypothetical protein
MYQRSVNWHISEERASFNQFPHKSLKNLKMIILFLTYIGTTWILGDRSVGKMGLRVFSRQ